MENLVVLDCEVYPNYFLIAFKNIDKNKPVTIEIRGEDNNLSDEQAKKLKNIMIQRTTFGFNSNNYDIPVILHALKGKSAKEICDLSNHIIENNSPSWKTLNDFGLMLPSTFNHFDIQEVAPGVRVSLKLYGGRMNSKKLQDLPIEPNSILTEKEMEDIKLYCINDLDTTIDLYRQVEDRVNLRSLMSKEYNQNLMSKSDAQIAEIVIKSELTKGSSKRLYAPKLPEGMTFRYNSPNYITFETEQLRNILDIVNNHDFELDGKGSVKLPDELKKTKIKIGDSIYQMGIGGLHSTEKKQVVIPKDDEILADRDVAAYYPNIILNEKLYPRQLGPKFLNVYEDIVKRRLKAKKEGDKVVNESLKIVINGSFGKLGSKYSALYSPDLMIAVTLTGQLTLLMLIEQLEKHDVKVVSANTDGLVSLLKKQQYPLYDSLCFDWELDTGLTLEETEYKALYSRDVNNYLAVTTDDKTKGKGIFAIGGLSKSPQAPVCVMAVIDHLTKGTCIEKFIKNIDSVPAMLTLRSVTGGAVYRGKYLGRVVRWYYSTNGDTIYYKKNGNKVAKSDGAKPLMELGEFPDDIDYDRYIREAQEILTNLGL